MRQAHARLREQVKDLIADTVLADDARAEPGRSVRAAFPRRGRRRPRRGDGRIGELAVEAGWTVARGIDQNDLGLIISGVAAATLDIVSAAIDPIAYVAGIAKGAAGGAHGIAGITLAMAEVFGGVRVADS